MQRHVIGAARAHLPGRRKADVLPLDWRKADGPGMRLLEMVADNADIPAAELLHRSRREASIAATRQLAMYLMHVVLRRTYADVGRFFGRDRTTVSYACAHIEDRRDDDAFEARVAVLETQIAEAVAAPEVDCRAAG